MRAIVIELESVRVGADGTATGVIYWDVEGAQFPEAGWNDFVVVILGWWLQDVIALLRGETKDVALDFMDGPFSVLLRVDNEHVAVHFVDRSRERQPSSGFQLDRNEIRQMVLHAAEGIYRHLRLQGIVSDEIEGIRRLSDALAEIQ